MLAVIILRALGDALPIASKRCPLQKGGSAPHAVNNVHDLNQLETLSKCPTLYPAPAIKSVPVKTEPNMPPAGALGLICSMQRLLKVSHTGLMHLPCVGEPPSAPAFSMY